jgi:hypothetical protein
MGHEIATLKVQNTITDNIVQKETWDFEDRGDEKDPTNRISFYQSISRNNEKIDKILNKYDIKKNNSFVLKKFPISLGKRNKIVIKKREAYAENDGERVL